MAPEYFFLTIDQKFPFNFNYYMCLSILKPIRYPLTKNDHNLIFLHSCTQPVSLEPISTSTLFLNMRTEYLYLSLSRVSTINLVLENRTPKKWLILSSQMIIPTQNEINEKIAHIYRHISCIPQHDTTLNRCSFLLLHGFPALVR